MRTRYAIISNQYAVKTDTRTVDAYLPDNYRVAGTLPNGDIVIAGEDRLGWTLDAYVLPRLASGLIFASEVDPSSTHWPIGFGALIMANAE